MPEYIKREELINQIRLMANRSSVGETSLNDISAKTICSLILEAPTADVVSREVFEQVKWERDTALQTLKEHGIGLGETADVVEVVRCKNCKYSKFTPCEEEELKDCPLVYECCLSGDCYTENDFCSLGKKKEGAEE